MSREKARQALEKHRHECMITCEETCLCWELEALLESEPKDWTEGRIECSDKKYSVEDVLSEPECPNCDLKGEAAKLPHTCKLQKSEPPAEEFTTLARHFLPPKEVFEQIEITDISEQPGQLERLLHEACDEIDRLKADIESYRNILKTDREVIEQLQVALQEYGRHGRNSDGIMCERSKHSDYPCTCGFEQALKGK